jgi:DNA polymerase-3 subunit delta'
VYGFELIRGQQQAIGLLTTLLRKGDIPHALVFTGIDGIGKQTAAKAMAMACNCADPVPFSGSDAPEATTARINACGRCRSCRRILSDNHPDILYLRPSGNMIRIALIRDLIGKLALKPYAMGKRVVIIAESHTMNPEAGNALLKVLEEPPDNTLLILTARQTSDLLPTIVSRCQQIRFAPLKADLLIELLSANGALTAEDAAAAAALSGGSYSQALNMVSEGWILRRRWLVSEIRHLNDQSTTRLLALAEKLSARKTSLPDTLTWLMGWYRDLMVYPLQPDQIVNRDLHPQIREAAAGENPQSLVGKLASVQSALKALQANANPRLTMEDLVLQLAAA